MASVRRAVGRGCSHESWQGVSLRSFPDDPGTVEAAAHCLCRERVELYSLSSNDHGALAEMVGRHVLERLGCWPSREKGS